MSLPFYLDGIDDSLYYNCSKKKEKIISAKLTRIQGFFNIFVAPETEQMYNKDAK